METLVTLQESLRASGAPEVLLGPCEAALANRAERAATWPHRGARRRDTTTAVNISNPRSKEYGKDQAASCASAKRFTKASKPCAALAPLVAVGLATDVLR